jgi:hypothetical protein
MKDPEDFDDILTNAVDGPKKEDQARSVRECLARGLAVLGAETG